MRIAIPFICLALLGCKQITGSTKTSESKVDTLIRNFNGKFVKYQQELLFDSATIFLNRMSDSVKKINNDRLTLFWLLNKSQNALFGGQIDSSTLFINSALGLLSSKNIKSTDSLNTYLVYQGILRNKKLLDSALRIGNEAYYLSFRNDTVKTSLICLELSEMYANMDDFQSVRKYISEAWKYKYKDPQLTNAIAKIMLAYYDRMNDADSAMYFLNVLQKTPSHYGNQPGIRASLFETAGIIFNRQKKYKEALQMHRTAKAILDSIGDRNGLFYNNLADAYRLCGKYDSAFRYIDSAISIATEKKNYSHLYIALITKSELLFDKGDYKNAYKALDSSQVYFAIQQDSSFIKHSRELETQYAVREKDNQINSLSLTARANLKIRNQQRIIIVTIVIASILLAVTGFLYYRRRQAQMQLRENNLRLLVLRNQMEPHFLFNSLTILQNFIRRKETDASIAYLNNLAKLIRFYFENAQENFVSLAEEIAVLKSYLELQMIYRPGVFVYTLEIYDGYEQDDVAIPPLLLQPFVENAIQHGFASISYRGDLKIVIQKNQFTLRCLIEDNGSSSNNTQTSSVIKQTKRRTSTQISRERLAILEKQTGISTEVTIIQKEDLGEGNGVVVKLDIPFRAKT